MKMAGPDIDSNHNFRYDCTDPINSYKMRSKEEGLSMMPASVSYNGYFNGAADGDNEETYLYDPELISRLTFEQSKQKFRPHIPGPTQPGTGMKVRPLSSGDFDRGYIRLLGQLTDVGSVSKADYLAKFNRMKSCPNTYYITVIVDTELDLIIGAGTIVVEQKFIHNCGERGIIEDIVVSDQYRGKQLGKLVVATLIEIGREIGCYKITLNCKDDLVKWYNGFAVICEPGNANFMQIRIPQRTSPTRSKL